MSVTLFIFLLQSKVLCVFLLQLQEEMKSALSIWYPPCIFPSNLARTCTEWEPGCFLHQVSAIQQHWCDCWCFSNCTVISETQKQFGWRLICVESNCLQVCAAAYPEGDNTELLCLDFWKPVLCFPPAFLSCVWWSGEIFVKWVLFWENLSGCLLQAVW